MPEDKVDDGGTPKTFTQAEVDALMANLSQRLTQATKNFGRKTRPCGLRHLMG